jgi:hypothetical protein
MFPVERVGHRRPLFLFMRYAFRGGNVDVAASRAAVPLYTTSHLHIQKGLSKPCRIRVGPSWVKTPEL